MISISGRNYTGIADHNVHTTNNGYQRKVICYKPPQTKDVYLILKCSDSDGKNARDYGFTTLLQMDWENIKQCECTAARSKTSVRFNIDCK